MTAELTEEELKDLLESLEDLEVGRYRILSSELSEGEFLQRIREI